MANTVYTPGVVKVDKHSELSATIAIEPLYSGYGNTLGNSLRRVLLSSIAGAAVTSFKIDGVSHEYTSIPGIKEDGVDIMLNLKGLRFKVYSDEPQRVSIKKSGRGPVTGADIKVNSDVEVVNPDHVIANIDDPKSEFGMELVVEVGRGYRPIEQSSARKPSEFIAIDSIFSPVRRVRYKIESTRVGQITDLDRLLITIDTDGSITPSDAFEQASAILVDQYTALAGKTQVASEAIYTESAKQPEVEVSESVEEPEVLDTPIEDLNLTARTTNALVNNDIHTIRDLFSLSDAEMRDLKGFGNKALDEVKDKMAELEL